jgi:hypothetical protein
VFGAGNPGVTGAATARPYQPPAARIFHWQLAIRPDAGFYRVERQTACACNAWVCVPVFLA